MGTRKLKKKIISFEKNTGNSEDEMLDFDKELFSLTHYVDDEEELIAQLFSIIKGVRLEAMLPPILKEIPLIDLQNLCLHELRGMSSRRILSIINGQEMSGSSSEGSGSSDNADYTRRKTKGKGMKEKLNKDSELTALDLLELEMRAKLIKNMLEKDPSDEDGQAIKIKHEPLSPSQIKRENISENVYNGMTETTKKLMGNRGSSESSYSSYTRTETSGTERSKSRSSSRRCYRPTKKKLTKKEFEERMRKARINRKYRSRKHSENDYSDNDRKSRRRSRRHGKRHHGKTLEEYTNTFEQKPAEEEGPIEPANGNVRDEIAVAENEVLAKSKNLSKDAELVVGNEGSESTEPHVPLQECEEASVELRDNLEKGENVQPTLDTTEATERNKKNKNEEDKEEGEASDSSGNSNTLKSPPNQLVPFKQITQSESKSFSSFSSSYDSFSMSDTYSSRSRSSSNKRSKKYKKKKYRRSYSRSSSRSRSPRTPSPSLPKMKKKSKPSLPLGIITLPDKHKTAQITYSKEESWGQNMDIEFLNSEEENENRKELQFIENEGTVDPPILQSFPRKRLVQKEERPSVSFGFGKTNATIMPNPEMQDEAIPIKEYPMKNKDFLKESSSSREMDSDGPLPDAIHQGLVRECASSISVKQKDVQSPVPDLLSVSVDHIQPEGSIEYLRELEAAIHTEKPEEPITQKEQPEVSVKPHFPEHVQASSLLITQIKIEDDDEDIQILDMVSFPQPSTEEIVLPDEGTGYADYIYDELQEKQSSRHHKKSKKSKKYKSKKRRSSRHKKEEGECDDDEEIKKQNNDCHMTDLEFVEGRMEEGEIDSNEEVGKKSDLLHTDPISPDEINVDKGSQNIDGTSQASSSIHLDETEVSNIEKLKQLALNYASRKESTKNILGWGQSGVGSNARMDNWQKEHTIVSKLDPKTVNDQTYYASRQSSCNETITNNQGYGSYGNKFCEPVEGFTTSSYNYSPSGENEQILYDLPIDDSSLPDSISYRDSPLDDFNTDSQHSLPGQKLTEIIGTIELADGSEVFGSTDHGGSSWNSRWLQSEKVQKVVSNSTLLSKVRKKIQMKGKVQDRRTKIAMLPNPIQDSNLETRVDRAYQLSKVGKAYQASKINQIQQKSHIKHIPLQVNLHPQSVIQSTLQSKTTLQGSTHHQPNISGSNVEGKDPTSLIMKASYEVPSSPASTVIGSVEEYQRLFNSDGTPKGEPTEDKGGRSGKLILLDSDDDDSDDELWSKILK